jgi:predicted ester cyclase
MFCHEGDLDTAGEFYASDYVLHEPASGEVRGLEAARQFAATCREAFPDLHSAVEDQVARGDKVVSRFSGSDTHLGETEDFGPATGNRIEITGITIDRFADGRIVEEWTNYDALGLLQQIGLIPEADGQEA